MKNMIKSTLSLATLTALPMALIMVCLPASAAGVVCADFKTQAEAQAYFDAKKPGYKRLDRDKDGIACEALP